MGLLATLTKPQPPTIRFPPAFDPPEYKPQVFLSWAQQRRERVAVGAACTAAPTFSAVPLSRVDPSAQAPPKASDAPMPKPTATDQVVAFGSPSLLLPEPLDIPSSGSSSTWEQAAWDMTKVIEPKHRPGKLKPFNILQQDDPRSNNTTAASASPGKLNVALEGAAALAARAARSIAGPLSNRLKGRGDPNLSTDGTLLAEHERPTAGARSLLLSVPLPVRHSDSMHPDSPGRIAGLDEALKAPTSAFNNDRRPKWMQQRNMLGALGGARRDEKDIALADQLAGLVASHSASRPRDQELEVIESSGLGLGDERMLLPKEKVENAAGYEKQIDPLIQELIGRQAGHNLGLKPLSKDQRAKLPEATNVDFGAARLRLKKSPAHRWSYLVA